MQKKVIENNCELLIKVINSGDSFWYGSYPQTESGDPQLIEWQVLEKKDNKLLLISKYALDLVKYNNKYEFITWENCTLRKWLNDEFFNKAFSCEEQKKIQSTIVSADKNPESSTNPGNATTDKVFMLSIAEVEKYFSSNSERRCEPTEYAFANGAYVESDNGNCWWWLRSPGDSQNYGALVYDDGVIGYDSEDLFEISDCVRPALWISLE